MASNLVLLDSSLSSVLSTPARLAVINQMFGLHMTETEFGCKNNEFDAYFKDWFEEKCGVAQGQVGAKTLGEVVDIVVHLRSLTSKTKREIKGLLQSSSPFQNQEEEFLDASIDLAARVWLMVSIGTLQHTLTPGQVLTWNNDDTLADTVEKALWSEPQLLEKIKIPTFFTAANLERIAGIRVGWTSNLADHLSLTEDDTKISLFHQASFLQLHKHSKRFNLRPQSHLALSL